MADNELKKASLLFKEAESMMETANKKLKEYTDSNSNNIYNNIYYCINCHNDYYYGYN